MKVNHLNLTVTDPVETQQFFVKYFGLKPRGKGNQTIALLSDDNGVVLSLMGRDVSTEKPTEVGAAQLTKKPLLCTLCT